MGLRTQEAICPDDIDRDDAAHPDQPPEVVVDSTKWKRRILVRAWLSASV
jgi:hypothetical protein